MRITLCGSAKFENRFIEWNERLTMKGHVVYSLAVMPSSKGDKNWYTLEQKTILDQVHLAKILNSDAIVVLNEDGGYYGESTTNEIRWARMNGKKVYWTMPHMPKPIDDAWAGCL